jgi:hypothetical protein
MAIIGEWGNLNSWFLENTETKLLIRGQYPAEVTENLSNNYATHQALGRQNPVLQFLSGELETLSLPIVLYARDAVDQRPKAAIKNLKDWRAIDAAKRRPAILHFWIGDSHLNMPSCVIQSLSSIVWHHPTELGKLRHVTLTINLAKYVGYSFTPKLPTETRYHRARSRDYYEMLCYYEYGDPNLGDVIRKRHSQKLGLKLADIVKLPSIEAIRKERQEPKSLILATSFGDQDTPQKQARLDMFDKRTRTQVSHVVGDE